MSFHPPVGLSRRRRSSTAGGSMPDTYDVISTREFAAPATEVWRAWSDPEYVTQWWGPHGFTSPSADLDFRVGGTSLVCMRAPAEFGGGTCTTPGPTAGS